MVILHKERPQTAPHNRKATTMHWDPDRYEQWFDTPHGQFALEREVQLLQAVLAGWPRRGRKLLEIGCGTGLFLEHLYQMGFDVSGIDSSPDMIMAARQRFGNRAELYHGDGELLPFIDNEFDYAFLWSVLEFTDDPAAMLAEAARVAEKGLLIGFLNRNSLYYTMNVKDSSGRLAGESGSPGAKCRISSRKPPGSGPPCRVRSCPAP